MGGRFKEQTAPRNLPSKWALAGQKILHFLASLKFLEFYRISCISKNLLNQGSVKKAGKLPSKLVLADLVFVRFLAFIKI